MVVSKLESLILVKDDLSKFSIRCRLLPTLTATPQFTEPPQPTPGKPPYFSPLRKGRRIVPPNSMVTEFSTELSTI